MTLRTYWDKVASKGTYQMGPQSHRIYLLNLLKEKGITSMLDVGCGTGPLYEILSYDWGKVDSHWDMIKKYKGVDYSEEMIKVCKREFPEGDFEWEDARSLTEADNSYDAVILMHTLDHIDEYQKAIDEATRVAKKYVIIILWRPVSDGDKNNLNSHNSMERDFGEWQDTHLQDYSKKKLLEAFQKAGLTIEMQKADEEIQKEAKFTTIFLLKKV